MVYKRVFIVIFAFFCLISEAYTQNNELELVKISQYILSSANMELARMNSSNIDKYIKEIMECYNDYLLSENYRNEVSAIILFAFNENNQNGIWLVDNYSNSNNDILYNLLMRLLTRTFLIF